MLDLVRSLCNFNIAGALPLSSENLTNLTKPLIHFSVLIVKRVLIILVYTECPVSPRGSLTRSPFKGVIRNAVLWSSHLNDSVNRILSNGFLQRVLPGHSQSLHHRVRSL